MLKSGLMWSATWWRWVIFYRHRPVDRWVLAGGIDRFPIATSDHADSSGFVVRISPRANPKDQVVIDGVSIDSRVRLSIRFVIAGCLTTAWNVVAEFLRHRWNSKPIAVVHRSSCSWVRCSISSSSPTMNGSILNRNCMPVGNFLS
jgi:hypothetical protein